MAFHISSNGLVLFNHSVTHKREEGRFAEHSHPLHEFAYYLRGNITYRYDGNEIHPRPGSVIISPSGILHELEVDGSEPYERHILHFYHEALPKDLQEYLAPRLFSSVNYFEDIPDMQAFMDAMENTFNMPGKAREEAIRIHLSAVMLYLARNNNMQDTEHASTNSLSRILEFVNMNIQDAALVNPAALARHFYFSRSQLNKLFLRHTGMSVAEYIRSKHFTYAEVLRSSGMLAGEAAAESGFQSYSTYYRIRRARSGQEEHV